MINKARLKMIIPYKGIRRIIGERMVESLRTMAQANHRIHIDMTKTMEIRSAVQAGNENTPSITSIITKAVAISLKENPILNSELTSEGIVMHDEINIGIAVASEDGLMVPVIKNCDELTISQLDARIKTLSEKARIRKLTGDEMAGGTFTITNLGMYGIEGFTAIINPPQAGILAIGATIQTPVVVAGELAVRPQMEVCLSYDHRIVDGAPAARFLVALKEYLEGVSNSQLI